MNKITYEEMVALIHSLPYDTDLEIVLDMDALLIEEEADYDDTYCGWSASTRYSFEPDYPIVNLQRLISEYYVSTLDDVINYYLDDSAYTDMISKKASKVAAKCAYYSACYAKANGDA